MTPLLSLAGMTKRFGGLPAVDRVDLDVPEGQILAVIGPNGAGKTTLLSLVAGALTPTACRRFTLAGQDLRGLPVHRIRRAGVGTLRQTPTRFLSMTVREDVAIGARFGGRVPLGHGQALAAADRAVTEAGLAARSDDPVTSLTLHQARLLGLARALAGDPKLLLLDEPLAGLSSGELEEALAVLRRLRDERGVTIVWVEHVMPAVDALADRVVVMDVGRILADGAPASVRRDPAVIAAYLGAPDAGASAAGGDAPGREDGGQGRPEGGSRAAGT